MHKAPQYRLDAAEKIRAKKRLTPEQFSVLLRFSHRAYPVALGRGYLTYRMALEISRRFGIQLQTMEV